MSDLMEMYGGGSSNDLMSKYSNSDNTSTNSFDSHESPYSQDRNPFDLISQYNSDNNSTVGLMDSYSDFDGYSNNYSAMDMGQGLDSGGSSDFTRKAWVGAESQESAGLLGTYQGLNSAIKTHLRNDMAKGDGQQIDTAVADMLFNDNDSPIDEIIGRRVGIVEKTRAGIFANTTLNIVAQTKLMDQTGIGKGGISAFAEGKDKSTIDSFGDADDWAEKSELASFDQADWTNGPDIFADPYEEQKPKQSVSQDSEKTEYSVFSEKSSKGTDVKEILTGKGNSNPFDNLGNKAGGRDVEEILTGKQIAGRKYDNAFMVAKDDAANQKQEIAAGDPSEMNDDWSNQQDSWSEQSDDNGMAGELFAATAVLGGMSVAERLNAQKTVTEELSEKLNSNQEIFKGKGAAEVLDAQMQKKKFRSDVPMVERTSVQSDEFLLRVKKEEKSQKDLRSMANGVNCNAGLVGCEDEIEENMHRKQQEIARNVFTEKNSIEYKLKKLEEKLDGLNDEELEKQRIIMSSKTSNEAKTVLHMIIAMQQSRKISAEIKARQKPKE